MLNALVTFLVILGVIDVAFDIYDRIEREIIRKIAIKQLKSNEAEIIKDANSIKKDLHRFKTKVSLIGKPLFKLFASGLKQGFNEGNSADK